MTQFSLFGAEASAPALPDLDGLLLAGAAWVQSRAGARLSIVVADRWRAEALADAFETLGLAGPDAFAETPSGTAVRTAFVPGLVDPARRWTRGARQGLPADFVLGAGALRLWTIAAGRRDDAGYLLATVPPDDPRHAAAGAGLARLGVAAVSLSQRPGPGWRVTSARRVRRLVELVGAEPVGAGDAWPQSILAR